MIEQERHDSVILADSVGVAPERLHEWAKQVRLSELFGILQQQMDWLVVEDWRGEPLLGRERLTLIFLASWVQVPFSVAPQAESYPSQKEAQLMTTPSRRPGCMPHCKRLVNYCSLSTIKQKYLKAPSADLRTEGSLSEIKAAI